MSAPQKVCVLCNLVVTPGAHSKSLAVKVAGTNVNYDAALRSVFTPIKGGVTLLCKMETSSALYKEDRILCYKCGVVMKNAYVGLVNLREALHVDSYINGKIKQGEISDERDTQQKQQVEVGVTEKISRKRVAPNESPPSAGDISEGAQKKTPVVRKIKNALKVARTRLAVENELAVIVKTEFLAFIRASKFTGLDEDEGILSDSKQLADELEKHCPSVFKLLSALTGDSGILTPAIRTIVALAAYTRNHTHNGFQKALGLTLFSCKAPVKVSKQLFYYNICSVTLYSNN